jgi:hypothetical protein
MKINIRILLAVVLQCFLIVPLLFSNMPNQVAVVFASAGTAAIWFLAATWQR